MPLDPTQPSDIIKFRNYAQACRANFQAIYDVVGANVDIGAFPTGTKMWFYQATAPEGWSIISTLTDCLLGVVNSAEGAIYSTAGETAGTWQQAGHQLTIAELASHFHTQNYIYSVKDPSGSLAIQSAPIADVRGSQPTSSVGGDQAHDHGDTWRPMAAIGIIAEKD